MEITQQFQKWWIAAGRQPRTELPFLAEIVQLEEPHKTRCIKALPKGLSQLRVKVNPDLPNIKAQMVAGAKKAGAPTNGILRNVEIEDGEVLKVAYRLDGAEIQVEAGTVTLMEKNTAIHGMQQVNPRTGKHYALIVDEGWEGGAVLPADGTPGEVAPKEKETSVKGLFEAGKAAGLVNELEDDNQPGWYYGTDVESGVFLGKSEAAAIRALGGKHKAVAEALNHQVGA
ncbi:MAG: hypothetical protein V3W37_03155 [Candidatus Binatia bacterium]